MGTQEPDADRLRQVLSIADCLRGLCKAGEYEVDITRQKWYLESMNKKHTAKFRMSDRRNDDFVPGTPADRLSLVWPLTREIASLSKKHDVERRLQRHVTRLVRREG